ncbi:hypothetical protein VFPBJ_02332 [Purpureocillium lilacinum]|uniref:Uncharacterized protein n=1 Tax=Purpureocillium lilacinum TaxID=33203 RepID=A0A179H091_PURLI|nr:hypothetical protein VFPBJ_02332 [Purpureocillium lilacinum]
MAWHSMASHHGRARARIACTDRERERELSETERVTAGSRSKNQEGQQHWYASLSSRASAAWGLDLSSISSQSWPWVTRRLPGIQDTRPPGQSQFPHPGNGPIRIGTNGLPPGREPGGSSLDWARAARRASPLKEPDDLRLDDDASPFPDQIQISQPVSQLANTSASC